MIRIVGVELVLALLLPLTVKGQEWTPEQQETWAWEVACLETLDLETKAACFHDDFIGLGMGEAEPTTKTDRMQVFAETLEAFDLVSFDLRPLAINLRGNTAILIYEAAIVMRNRSTGEETMPVVRWTDVAVREGGRWTWIADHGTVVEEGSTI
jgi:hypothetical protein